MKTFKVSTGVIKKANQLLINSNNLDPSTETEILEIIQELELQDEARKILERNYIKLYSC